VLIPPSAVERLLSLADRQSEGAVDRSGDPPTYFGSTFLVLGLAKVRAAFAGRGARSVTSEDLARAVRSHPGLRLRILRTAREEAERRMGPALAPGTARVCISTRPSADALTIEAAIEVPCRECGRSHAVAG